MLGACGGSQPPIGAPGAMPKNATATASVQRAASGDLVYAVGGCGGVCVLSYPSGQVVSSITLSGDNQGACSDGAGNVFITNNTSTSQVIEYAHGGTTPITILALPGNTATGCSVDTVTGNLAVTFLGNYGNVAVFPGEIGPPTIYSTNTAAFYCGYDNAGNLFVSGRSNGAVNVAELVKGDSAFQVFSLKGKVGDPGQMQWDGSQMTLQSLSKGHIRILGLQISGSTAKVVGTTHLKNIRGNASQSWLYGNEILVPYGNGGQFETQIGVWDYPAGGKVQTRYRHFGVVSFHGVTVSVAPSR